MTISRIDRRLRLLARNGLLVPALAAALGAATLAAPSGAAETPDPPAVTGADLPQVVRVDNIFPYLRGGSRDLIRSNRLEVAGADCIHQTAGYRAASVRFAHFTTRDGESPFFQGREDPTFVVYEFVNPARARKGYQRIVDYVRRCAGTHRADGFRVTVRRVGVPALGTREIAFRTANTNGGLKQDVEVYVLEGNRIERSWIQLDTDRPQLRRVVRMARLLADTAR